MDRAAAGDDRGHGAARVLGLVVGLLFIQNPQGNFEVLVVAGGLWLSYLAVTELVGLIRVRRGQRQRSSTGVGTVPVTS